MVTEGLVEATDEDEEGSMGSDFYVVDAKYGSVDTTDLEITVDSKECKATFDVGPAVHDPAGKR